jgi:hypothetical protein
VNFQPIIVSIVLLVIVGAAGCGGSQPAEPVSDAAAPQTGPGGPILRGLTSGRQVMAPDGRYSMFVPADWLEINIGLAEVSFRSSDLSDPYSLNVAREQLEGIRQPQVYAEAGRRSVSGVYSNVLTLSMTPVQVGEVAAYRWVYTAVAGGSERLYYQLYLIDGGEGFVVTGNAPVTSDLSRVQALFDSIAGSISFARG